MGKILSALKMVVAAIFGGGLVWIALSYKTVSFPDANSNMPLAALDMTYTDFITIMLTSVTVVLAAVGIGVGVVAAYTITKLTEDAETSVDQAVTKRMVGVEEKLQQRIAELVYGVGRNLHSADDLDEDMEDR